MGKRILAVGLALVLALGLLPAGALAEEPSAVDVRVSFYDGGSTQSFLMTPRALAVAPGTAAAKGYSTPQLTANADKVTVFDALVAAHQVILGDGDAQTIQAALTIGESGYLTQVMGESGAYGPAFGFAVNKAAPNDGVYNEAYGGYTGYTADQAVLESGDTVEFFFYEDTDGYSDYYATLSSQSAAAYVGQPLELTAAGYMIGWYGCATAQTIQDRTQPLEGAKLCVADPSTGELSPVEGAVTDEAGGVSVTFDAAGVYALSLSSDSDYVIAPWLEVTVEELPATSVTAPIGETVRVERGSAAQPYQTAREVESLLAVTDEAAGATTYYYDWTEGGSFSYRVIGDHPPYGGILTQGGAVTVTEEQLKPEGKTRTTVDHDAASNGGVNVADLYMNVNPQGHLTLAVQDTYQLVCLRSWQAVNSVTVNRFMEPDYHYTVLNEDGQADDGVVTVSDSGLITAKAAGTAIVLVTYDAMSYADGAGGPFFGAIWPENTGVFVVTVGAEDSGIDTGMTINAGMNAPSSKLSGNALDAELDTIYFTGTRGSYTFTPGAANCSVSVANPTVEKVMTFTGFEPVEANADGSFTVPLTQGRNVVKVERDGRAAYQVVTAKRLSVTVNGGAPVHPGDPLTITFDTLYQPNKLAKLYNGVAGALYTTPDGRLVGSVEGGSTGAYSVAAYQTISTYVSKETERSDWGDQVNYVKGDTLTVPSDYDRDTYTLTGGVMAVLGNAYCGEYGLHREITRTGDAPTPRSTAAVKDAVLGRLPDVEIPITREGGSSGGSDSGQIAVSFTLLGDQKHGAPTGAAGVHTMKDNNLETWIAQTTVSVPKGSKVIDVVTRALDRAGIPYENPDGNYITSIQGLGELDNGGASGWLYTLNGAYPQLSVADQTVSGGDAIVFHYTDDFSREGTAASMPSGGGGGSGGGAVAVDSRPAVEVMTDQAGRVTARITLPAGSDRAAVRVPVQSAGPGTVLVVTDAGGNETVLKKAILDDDAIAALVDGSCTVAVADRAGAFDDVAESHWAKSAVDFVSSRQLFLGTGERSFSPEMPMSRAMLATVLYRLEEGSAGSGASPFADVKAGEWYADAVTWANGAGIVTGDGSGFAPDRAISRQELVVMLYRYAKLVGVDTAKRGALEPYADKDRVADWADEAMSWAVGSGLLTGRSADALAPADTADRGEVAALLERMVTLMVRESL